MTAIFKREFKSFFSSPIGYIFLAIMTFWSGLWFWMIFTSGSPDISVVILSATTVIIFAIPILTMRLMSDDRRQKVDQVLLTSPVSLTAIVLGKFLAAFAVFALAFAPTVIYEIVIAALVKVEIMAYIYPLLGMLLLGATLISLGMFFSSLTESPALSAILSIAINILVTYLPSIVSLIPTTAGETFLEKAAAVILKGVTLVLEKLSFISIAESFGENIFSIVNIVYFLSIIFFFLFLCVRSLEKRRWA